ncbi:MAG: hypothetical protein OEV78_11275 [Spirochaetia bacterium]|nr:hypothetical protein [Spirochaetia bacterium]
MNLNKNKIKYICSVIFIFYTSALYSQFILPEDRYTTQKDIDVIRINDDGIDVKNIRAIAKKNSQGEVEISWRYVKNSVPVAVIRNDRAMSNMSLLKLGKIINILDAGQVTLKDTIVTPGDYYYAVVSYQKFKEESTMLKLDENYTSIPIHFDESDLNSNIKLKKEYVENIKAEALDNKTVRIRWNFEPVPNVNLLIYKSTSEINNESKLKTSTRIGTVASEKNYFDDENDSSGDFFMPLPYLISLKLKNLFL